MNEISIRIFWGPWGGEIKPSPIVSVGNVVGTIVPSAPVLVKEDKSWMIKTDERKAVYSCHSKERCFGSDSYMQLLVCVILPKGKRLSGEKSPLDLLEDIRNQFDLLFTIDIDAVLPPKEEVEAAFTQVLSNYVVVDCPWYVFNMEGEEPASFQVDSRSQLNALMRYNAYPALAHVEHLELGFKCETTVNINTKGESNGGSKKENKSKWWERVTDGNEPKKKPTKEAKEFEKEQTVNEGKTKVNELIEENFPKVLPEMMEDLSGDTQYPDKVADVVTNGKNMFPNLEIPCPVSYEVFVDGDSTNTFLKDRNGRYTARKIASENYKYDSLSFSLGELLDREDGTRKNQSGTVVVKLDKNNRRIDCTMKPKPILYKIRVGYSDHSDDEAKKAGQKYLKDGSLRIRLDGKDLNFGDVALKPSDAKSAVKDKRFDVYPKEWNGYVFSVAKARLDEFNEEVVITLKAIIANDDHRGGHISSKRKYWIIGGIVGLIVSLLAGIAATNIVENMRNKRLVEEEIAAYYCANASSDTTVMKKYIHDYSAPQFKYPNQEHLTVIQKKLDDARGEYAKLKELTQAEAAAYNKCKYEILSLDERIAACEAYLEAKYTKNLNEIEQLREKLTAEKTAGDNAKAEKDAFDKCKKAQNQAYPANYSACQTYLQKHPQGANKATVDGYIKDIMNGRDYILELLNRRDLAGFRMKYGNIKWKMYITREEFNAFDYIIDHHNIALKDHRREVIVRHEIDDYLERNGRLNFNDWSEVMKVKREIDKIVAKYSGGKE